MNAAEKRAKRAAATSRAKRSEAAKKGAATRAAAKAAAAGQGEAQTEQLPPGVYVGRVPDGEGGFTVTVLPMGVELDQAPILLELGQKAARAKLGLPARD